MKAKVPGAGKKFHVKHHCRVSKDHLYDYLLRERDRGFTVVQVRWATEPESYAEETEYNVETEGWEE